jgi:hypothetical protein
MLAGQEYTPRMKSDDPIAAYLRNLASQGGKARGKKLSAARRKQIAKKAARTRWAKRKNR